MSWSVLQSASASAGSGSTISVTYGSNLTAGTKLIAVAANHFGASRSIATVKDGAGNSFTQIDGRGYPASTGETSLWAIDTPAGDAGTKPTITATINTGTWIQASILVQEVAGLATGTTVAAMIDGTPGDKNGTGGASTGSPTYSSTIVSEYLVSVYGDTGSGPETWTKPAALTADTNSINSSGGGAEPNIAIAYGNSAGGAESASWALSGTSATWATILCAFRLLGISPTAGLATSAGAAQAPTVSVSPNAGLATAAGAALRPHVVAWPLTLSSAIPGKAIVGDFYPAVVVPTATALFTGPVAGSGTVAATGSHHDPFTGRAAASGTFAGAKTANGALAGPAAAAGVIAGINANVGGLDAPAAAGGQFASSRIALGAFTTAAAAWGSGAGSPPVTGSFTAAVAATGLIAGFPPRPLPSVAAATITVTPANPFTLTVAGGPYPVAPVTYQPAPATYT